MEEKKGDVRVSIISALFFTCIVAGGVFLFLYMLLPIGKAKPWYPIVGLILVAIPWLFWILTCLYRCFKPGGGISVPTDGSGRYAKAGSGRTTPTATAAQTMSEAPAICNAPSAAGSPMANNSPGGNQRQVQFAGVVLMGSENGNGGNNQKGHEGAAQYHTIDVENHSGTNGSVGSTDSEMPLRLTV